MSGSDSVQFMRIIDANRNRASEAMRVVEEYCRFVLNDRHLSGECKRTRHLICQYVNQLLNAADHAARDILNDVGADITEPSEQKRASLDSVVRANLRRASESLRSLEEYTKTRDTLIAGQFESLRYSVYNLERRLLLNFSQPDLASRRLILLLDLRWENDQLETMLRPIVEAGVDILQLRDKRASDQELCQYATLLMQKLVQWSTDVSRCLLIINDRVDIAAAANADGVHLGQDDLPLLKAQAILPEKIIGVSTHNLEQIERATREGASYVGCGPTFPSRTKEFDDFAGPEFLQQVHEFGGPPAFAIGGIDASNVKQVLATGFNRIAVASSILDAESPAKATRELVEAMSVR